MTKEEQIKEMRREIEKGFQKANCREPYTNKPYPYFETQKIEIAEALYDAGYRKINSNENELLTAAVDAIFRGAVLRLAEKLKQRSYCDNCFKDGKWHRYVFIEDIDETAQKFLESET